MCKHKCPERLQYFDKNWKGCADMWAKHLRSRYFVAGNSTTNRIEAHWNQLKIMTGRKPTINKAVAGVLPHQRGVLRQLDQVLSRHAVKSRQMDTIPQFLWRVSGVVSDFALEKLVNQFELSTSRLQNATLRQPDAAYRCRWEILALGQRHMCNDIE